MALVSIIVTVYNRDRYLGAAIESILNQTYSDFELLIWDDGSSDRSVDIAQDYARKDKRVRVITAEHQGRVAALKAAHAEVIGTYIGWVDSDDLLAPTALEATVAILNTQPTVGMVYTNYLVIDEDNQVKGLGQRCHIPYSKDRLLVDFMTFHFRLMRRSIYEQIGGVDPTLVCEDYDICLKFSEVAEIYHLEQPLYYYRVHAQSISQQKRVEQILCAQQVIANALQRRGMADDYEIDVQITARYLLKRKKQQVSN